MSLGPRLLLAGLTLALVAFLFGVAVVPTHVSFGAGSLRCGTVVRPDRSELGAVWVRPSGCEPASGDAGSDGCLDGSRLHSVCSRMATTGPVFAAVGSVGRSHAVRSRHRCRRPGDARLHAKERVSSIFKEAQCSRRGSAAPSHGRRSGAGRVAAGTEIMGWPWGLERPATIWAEPGPPGGQARSPARYPGTGVVWRRAGSCRGWRSPVAGGVAIEPRPRKAVREPPRRLQLRHRPR